jgi:hypothetical protein
MDDELITTLATSDNRLPKKEKIGARYIVSLTSEFSPNST